MSDIATIIIDMQKYFMKNISHDRRYKLIYDQLSVLDYSMKQNMPIINVELIGTGPFWDFFDICDMIVPDIKNKLSGYSNVYNFKKNRNSAFVEDSTLYDKIVGKLNSLEIKELFVMGVNSDACVYESVIDASEKFKVHVADDTMTSDDNFLVFYPNIDARKRRFFEPSEGFYSETLVADPSIITYHDSYKDFIKYCENGRIK